MKLPLALDLDIHAFSGGLISQYETGLVNCVVHKANGRSKVTQRPSIDISEDSNTI